MGMNRAQLFPEPSEDAVFMDPKAAISGLQGGGKLCFWSEGWIRRIREDLRTAKTAPPLINGTEGKYISWIFHRGLYYICILQGVNFKHVSYFHPEIWGNDPIFDSYFSDGLKPPTIEKMFQAVPRKLFLKIPIFLCWRYSFKRSIYGPLPLANMVIFP